MSLFMHHIVKILRDTEYHPTFKINFKLKYYDYDFNEIFMLFD